MQRGVLVVCVLWVVCCIERFCGQLYFCLGRGAGAPKCVPGQGRQAAVGVVDKVFLVFSQGRGLQRFVEQIIDEDGEVLAVVVVPVICCDKFQQFLFFDVKVPQLQFIDRVAEAS